MADLSEHSKTVAKGSFWSLAGSILLKLSSFIYVIFLARFASQSDVGTFYLALSVISIITIFSDLGVSGAFLRYVPFFEGKGHRGKIRDLIGMSYKYLTLFSIIMMLLVISQADAIGVIYHNASLPYAIMVLAVYVLVGNIFRINYLYLQGTADIKGSQLYQNIQNLLKLVITVGMFYLFGSSIAAMSLAFVFSFIIALILSSPTIIRAVSALEGEERLSHREIVNEIIPLGILIAVLQYFSLMISSADRLVLGYLTPPADAAALVAVYSFATTLAMVLMTFPGAVGNIFFPVVSKLAGKGDTAAMRAVMATSQRWSLLITLPIAVVMVVFGADMMHIFYGASYASGGSVMAIFTLGLVFSALTYTQSLALTAMRLVKIELVISGIACIVNFALLIVLIPYLGMEGAALAGFACFFTSAILFRYYGHKILGYEQPPEVYRLLLSAFAAFLVVLPLKPYASGAITSTLTMLGGQSALLPKVAYLLYLGVMIIFAGLLFMLFSILFKCLKGEDVELMEQSLRKVWVPRSLIALASRIASYGVAG